MSWIQTLKNLLICLENSCLEFWIEITTSFSLCCWCPLQSQAGRNFSVTLMQSLAAVTMIRLSPKHTRSGILVLFEINGSTSFEFNIMEEILTQKTWDSFDTSAVVVWSAARGTLTDISHYWETVLHVCLLKEFLIGELRGLVSEII